MHLQHYYPECEFWGMVNLCSFNEWIVTISSTYEVNRFYNIPFVMHRLGNIPQDGNTVWSLLSFVISFFMDFVSHGSI